VAQALDIVGNSVNLNLGSAQDHFHHTGSLQHHEVCHKDQDQDQPARQLLDSNHPTVDVVDQKCTLALDIVKMESLQNAARDMVNIFLNSISLKPNKTDDFQVGADQAVVIVASDAKVTLEGAIPSFRSVSNRVSYQVLVA
jgi:hypothetical protein